MKKIPFLFLMLLTLFSCEQDEMFEASNISASTSNTLRSAGDGKYDVLGYGYDITKPYATVDAVKEYQIIDIAALIKAEPSNNYYFDSNGYSKSSARIFGGENYFKYVEDIVKKTNFSGSVASNGLTTDLKKGLFSAEAKISQEKETKFAYSTAYTYATAEIIQPYKRFVLDADVHILQKYLHPYFKQELEKVEASSSTTPGTRPGATRPSTTRPSTTRLGTTRPSTTRPGTSSSTETIKFVEKFGTHVLFKFTTGGQYRSDFKSLVIEESNSTTKKNVAEAGAKFGLSKIGLSASGGWEEVKTQEVQSKNHNWGGTLEIFGGKNNGISTTFSPGKEPSTTTNPGNWSASIDDATAVLIDLDWNATYPIYELIADPEKKELIKKAVIQYIEENTPEEIETTPLHRYRNQKRDKYYPTTAYGESRTTSGWTYEGIIGYLLKTGNISTVPLYRVWCPRTQGSHIATYNFQSSKDWINEGIIGYALKRRSTGTVPLYHYWNQKRETFYFTTTEGDSKITSDWKPYGIAGYVYPSDLPCVDTEKYPQRKPTPSVINW